MTAHDDVPTLADVQPLDLGRAMSVLMAARGMTQREVAAAARLAPSYISLLSNGKRRGPTLAAIASIANALSVPPEDIFTLASPKPDSPSWLLAAGHAIARALTPTLPTQRAP